MATRLSDIVKPGEDFPIKTKTVELIGQEIEIVDFKRTDRPDKDYYIVTVRDAAGVLKVFCTGARQIVSILDGLDENLLPVSCTIQQSNQAFFFDLGPGQMYDNFDQETE